MKTKALSAFMLLAALGGCMAQQPDEPIKVVQADSKTVVLRGLVDATRTAPPARYAERAQAECARFGRKAALVSMEQRTTFAFDMTYRCVLAG